MKDSNLQKKQFQYYLYIGLSVLDIVIGMICGIRLGMNLLAESFGKHATGFNTPGIHQGFTLPSVFINALYLVGLIICIIAFPVLTQKRQALRDEVEYDENGVSRKKGSFSQLSKAEREAIEQQKMMDAERILPSSFIKSATHIGSETPEKDLRKLIGLKEVKDEVDKMCARMEFAHEANERRKKEGDFEQQMSLTSMNMLMLGNPGTGKTTMARIMAAFLYKYGYIKKNQSIEVDGNFFNGLSAGESSKRTTALIRAARGGVLFIDEAYALLTGGQEVIATLVKAMEDYRDDTVFIFAGYEREMKNFIESNSGIQSRVKYTLHFKDYTDRELLDIFELMAHEAGFCVTSAILEKVSEELGRERMEPFFGNARNVRNLLDKIIDNHAVNFKQNKGEIAEEARYYLLGSDL